MILSTLYVLVVAQSSSEVPEGLMNNPVYVKKYTVRNVDRLCCLVMKNSKHYAAMPSVFVHQKPGNKKCSDSQQINTLCTQSWKPQANTWEILNGLHWLHWSV